MTEEIEQQELEQLDAGRYLDIVKRRHVAFLAAVLIGWGIVWGASWLIPATYKSSTLILVEPPSMPKNYVLPNVNDDLQSQIQSITQQIMSRTRLLRIIEKLNLYSDPHRPMAADQKVERMRKDIDVELVRNAQNATITAFRIYYSSRDPHIARSVTGELTNIFIHENLSVRQQQSEDTTKFLQSQLEIARTNLADQDAKVRAYQASHQGSLPAQEATNLQILSGLQSQLQSEQDALNGVRQQQVYHQSLIDQYRALGASSRTANGAQTDLATIDQQLDALRSKLQELSVRYTDRYPEVEDVKSQIAKAEKTRAQVVAGLKRGAIAKPVDASSSSPADPAYSASLLQLQSQVKADQLEVENREHAIAALKSRIEDYQGRLGEEPGVAQQLADLTRGYQQSQDNYNELLKKVSDSQMATTMEQLQEGERFTMIDPPSLPLKPDSPNRLKLCGIGLGAGLGAGLLIVLLLELWDDRLHSEKEIVEMLSTAVICEVPEIRGIGDEKRNRKRMMLGWAMAAAVLIVIVAGAAFSYLSA